MTKKIIFVLVCAALMLSISSSTVLAGSGGPPEVINYPTGDNCGLAWLKWRQDGTVMVPTMIQGTLSYVYNSSTGFWTTTCHLDVNFDNPTLGTIDEMCAVAEGYFPDQIDCTNGTFVWRGLDCYFYDMVTTDSQVIVSADGHGIVTCQFFP